jgi:hypothetical protein
VWWCIPALYRPLQWCIGLVPVLSCVEYFRVTRQPRLQFDLVHWDDVVVSVAFCSSNQKRSNKLAYEDYQKKKREKIDTGISLLFIHQTVHTVACLPQLSSLLLREKRGPPGPTSSQADERAIHALTMAHILSCIITCPQHSSYPTCVFTILLASPGEASWGRREC